MKKVKICGLKRPEDIQAVNSAKPDYCGFVVEFPGSIRSISIENLQLLRSQLSRDISAVGVFVNKPAEYVASLLNDDMIDIAQLHGSEDNSYVESLRRLTSKPIWKAFQIKSYHDISEARESLADFVILDAGQGSGKSFDWELLKDFTRPFGLAGGLNIESLDAAIKTSAILLDVSGGVESNGSKDADKIQHFVRAVKEKQ